MFTTKGDSLFSHCNQQDPNEFIWPDLPNYHRGTTVFTKKPFVFPEDPVDMTETFASHLRRRADTVRQERARKDDEVKADAMRMISAAFRPYLESVATTGAYEMKRTRTQWIEQLVLHSALLGAHLPLASTAYLVANRHQVMNDLKTANLGPDAGLDWETAREHEPGCICPEGGEPCAVFINVSWRPLPLNTQQ